MKAYYNHVKERAGNGSYAHVLTMKKLARMIHHMMLAEQNWKWENEALTETKLSRLDIQQEGEGGGGLSAYLGKDRWGWSCRQYH